MYIIIEGLDKQGKSSLANHLSKRFNLPIKKFSAPKEDPYIEYVEYLLENKEPAILDRYYLGELAYGPIKRGKSGLADWQVRNIERLLMARNALTIYCYTDELTTRENFKKENEEFTQIEEANDIVKLFNQAKQNSLLPWVTFNYTSDTNYMGINKLVERWYAKTSENLQLLKKLVDTRMTGSPFSKTIILGNSGSIDLTLSKYRNVIIGFANELTTELLYDIIPKTVALSNVQKWHESGEIKYLDIELNLPYLERVICLGNNAYNMIMEDRKNRSWTKRLQVYNVQTPEYILKNNMDIEKYKKELTRLII